MHNRSSVALLDLACSNSLSNLDLEVAPEISPQDEELVSAKLVSMKKLAGLKLAGLYMTPQTICIKNLRSLRELTLLQCKMTPLTLLRSSTLSLLGRLHMEDEMFEWAADLIRRGAWNIEIKVIEDILTRLGKNILSLPRLRQVSGDSSIMEMGMKGLLVEAPSIRAYTTRGNGCRRTIKTVHMESREQHSTNQ